jgi:hypothetical protein
MSRDYHSSHVVDLLSALLPGKPKAHRARCDATEFHSRLVGRRKPALAVTSKCPKELRRPRACHATVILVPPSFGIQVHRASEDENGAIVQSGTDKSEPFPILRRPSSRRATHALLSRHKGVLRRVAERISFSNGKKRFGFGNADLHSQSPIVESLASTDWRFGDRLSFGTRFYQARSDLSQGTRRRKA